MYEPETTVDGVPSSPANPDAHAAQMVRVTRKSRLVAHLKRMLVVSGVVLVAGAAVSVYFSVVGTRDCWREGRSEVCVERQWYALTFQQARETTTRDGVLDGVRREWFRNGELWYQGDYEHGERTGRRYEFWSDGAPRFMGTYVDDRLHGTEAWWYANGRPEWQVYRHRGERHGEEIWWHENGERRRIGHFRHGQRHGEFAHFNLDGSPAFSVEYDDGERELSTLGG